MIQRTVQQMQNIADVSSTPATYVASAVTVWAGLTVNEWVAVGGLILGLLTFATNFYFKHKHYSLARIKQED